MSNYNVDDFKPEATIKREGRIKITDVETGESEIHATYAAADVLKYLDRGYTIAQVMDILEGAD